MGWMIWSYLVAGLLSIQLLSCALLNDAIPSDILDEYPQPFLAIALSQDSEVIAEKYPNRRLVSEQSAPLFHGIGKLTFIT